MEEIGNKDEQYADQDTYFMAAEDQRVFGAGIKRKRVPFVPASTTESSTIANPNPSVGDKYLSIVLKKQQSQQETVQDQEAHAICDVCGQPSRESHLSSISHQLCLEHSHPPSHLPREHVGLKILERSGWDPDSRLGLGATGEGIRIPIKIKVKNDTVGLGIEPRQRESGKIFEVKSNDGVKRLNAKEVRKQDEEGRKRAQKLQLSFYGKDLSQYLGTDG